MIGYLVLNELPDFGCFCGNVALFLLMVGSIATENPTVNRKLAIQHGSHSTCLKTIYVKNLRENKYGPRSHLMRCKVATRVSTSR